MNTPVIAFQGIATIKQKLLSRALLLLTVGATFFDTLVLTINS
jgi:hypothetical protein